jgi:hypothetical protein
MRNHEYNMAVFVKKIIIVVAANYLDHSYQYQRLLGSFCLPCALYSGSSGLILK